MGLTGLQIHGLRTPGEEIAFTGRPKIKSQSQIIKYSGKIFRLPHWPKFSDFFDLCLHWVSVVRGFKYWTSYLYIALICPSSPRIKIFNPFLFLKKLCNSFDFVLALGGVRLFHFGAYDQKRNFSEIFDFRFNRVGLLACRLLWSEQYTLESKWSILSFLKKTLKEFLFCVSTGWCSPFSLRRLWPKAKL